MKFNVSSVCEGNRQGVVLGIIARSDTGNILLTWAITMEGIDNPVVAKVEVFWVAFLLAQQND